MKKTIYIAGPMRGYPNYNFDAFDTADLVLWAQGYTVINPTQLDRLYEGWEVYPPKDFVLTTEFKRRCIKRDLDAIAEYCDCIYMLKGWSKSTGAQLELALAEFLNLEVLYQDVR